MGGDMLATSAEREMKLGKETLLRLEAVTMPPTPLSGREVLNWRCKMPREGDWYGGRCGCCCCCCCC